LLLSIDVGLFGDEMTSRVEACGRAREREGDQQAEQSKRRTLNWIVGDVAPVDRP
jgi:hypothetical protein